MTEHRVTVVFLDCAPSGPTLSGDIVVSKKMIAAVVNRIPNAIYITAKRAGIMSILLDICRGYWIPAAGFRISSSDRKRILRLHEEDIVVLCNERTFGCFARISAGTSRTIYLWHNLPSNIERKVGGLFGVICSCLAFTYERAVIMQSKSMHIYISRLEYLISKSVYGASSRLIRVGCPIHSLEPANVLLRDAVISGTYNWWRKKQSLYRGMSAIESVDWDNIYCEDDVSDRLMYSGSITSDIAGMDTSDGIRFGIITDDFFGGFKLKCLEYITNNCIIISAVDISVEFNDIPFADDFIKYSRSFGDIDDIVESFYESPKNFDLRNYLEFKSAIREKFNWDSAVQSFVRLLQK